jgi:lysophospholipase L1-like esterase/pimeloyl-ACP methyl ester carboxylesterase
MMRRLQPDVMIRCRGIGNYGDYYTPEGFVPGAKENTNMPWMTIRALGSSFSYDKDGSKYKGAPWIIHNLLDAVSKGGNFMVGIGPDGSGRFHPKAIEQLEETGRWLKVNGEGIYGTRAREVWQEGNTRFTQTKDGKEVFAFTEEWPGKQWTLGTVKPKAGSPIYLLGYDKPLAWTYAEGKLKIEIPGELQSPEQRPCQYAWTFRIQQDKIRIACVGNSITRGARASESYPARLSRLLGDGYDVRNFGKGSATLLKKGNHPYWNSEEYPKALAFNPDRVFIKFGTNDSKLSNRPYLNEYMDDCKAMIRAFRELPSRPQITLLLPVPAYRTDTMSITAKVIEEQIIPMIRQVAYEEGCEVVNLFNLMLEMADLFPDTVHPNVEGYAIMADRIIEHVKQASDYGFHLKDVIPPDAKRFNHFGFQGYEFLFKGHTTRIVVPKQTAVGHPWIFRSAHWYGQPQTDIALLERGFHFVHCDIAESFANDEALAIWDELYKQLQQEGLSPKSVMEGMSRGGVYIYRWAAAYPDRVAAVYADAPVTDLRSWPGGKGRSKGAPKTWETFKKDFNLKSDEEAMNFKGSPIHLVDRIVSGKFPMLHVVGDKDKGVPIEENTLPFEQKIREAGGSIQVIHKPEIGHHPHSLPNPQPIVDFILRATGVKN